MIGSPITTCSGRHQPQAESADRARESRPNHEHARQPPKQPGAMTHASSEAPQLAACDRLPW